MNYQQQSLTGATGVELIVALYDGTLRFLYRAIRAVEENDVIERRFAVKRALDILVYLQACLRMDVGGDPAVALADFYTAMFQRTLEASHADSVEMFEEVIGCIRNVRDAWTVVAKDPAANSVLPRDLRTKAELNSASLIAPRTPAVGNAALRWSA